VLDVPINRNKHASIVGKRGLTLANMSADTNVRIMVPNKDLRHDVIQLEGDLPNVKQCLDRVLQVTTSSSSKASGNGGSGANSTPASSFNKGKPSKQQISSGEDAPERISQTVVLEKFLPTQTKIRAIGRKTDTSVKKRKVGDASWQLTVSGTKQDGIQNAIAILKKWHADRTVAAERKTTATAATNTASPSAADSQAEGSVATPSPSSQATVEGQEPKQQQQQQQQQQTPRFRYKHRNNKRAPKRKQKGGNGGGKGGGGGGDTQSGTGGGATAPASRVD